VQGVTYVSLDLQDALACRDTVDRSPPITHLVYAAVNETPGDLVKSWFDPAHAGRNGRMFANILDSLLDQQHGLKHVILIHGGKAYAPHHEGHLPVPLRESLPRPDFDDFYFRQEDHLWTRTNKSELTWTVLRAMIIVGGSRDSNLNGLLAICVMAALRREAGLDLPLPAMAHKNAVLEMTDVNLLADGIAWAAEAPEARNRIFNITNGDVFTWRDLWPVIASEMGLSVGTPASYSVRAEIRARAETWGELVRRHGLDVPEDPDEYLGESAALSDFALAADRNVITSNIAIRQAGFHTFIDTAESVIGWIRRWRTEGLLPPR